MKNLRTVSLTLCFLLLTVFAPVFFLQADSDDPADIFTIPEREEGYRVKILAHGVKKDGELDVVIRDTGESVIKAQPQDCLREVTYRGKKAVFFKIEDEDLLLIKATDLYRTECKLTLDLPIRSLEVEGDAEVEVEKTAKMLESIRMEGPCELELEDVDFEALEIKLAGPVEAEAEGKIEKLTLFLEGEVEAEFDELEVREAEVRMEGPGKLALKVSEQLSGSLEGPAELGYYGSPKVDMKTDGPAELKKLD